jgi:hypothetical protein
VDEEDPYLSLQEGRNRAEVKINDGEKQRFGGEMGKERRRRKKEGK